MRKVVAKAFCRRRSWMTPKKRRPWCGDEMRDPVRHEREWKTPYEPLPIITVSIARWKKELEAAETCCALIDRTLSREAIGTKEICFTWEMRPRHLKPAARLRLFRSLAKLFIVRLVRTKQGFVGHWDEDDQ
jgi:hypothetical protein